MLYFQNFEKGFNGLLQVQFFSRFIICFLLYLWEKKIPPIAHVTLRAAILPTSWFIFWQINSRNKDLKI